jgi:hypothetical protein
MIGTFARARHGARGGAHSKQTSTGPRSSIIFFQACLAAAIGVLLVGGVAMTQSEPVQAELSSGASVGAFPGAEGFGTDTVGGRGGRVLQVTNLNDSGPGNRAALTASGARTVILRVSGTIALKTPTPSPTATATPLEVPAASPELPSIGTVA